MAKAKKILNDPKNVVAELLEGLVYANMGRIKRLPGVNALVRTDIPAGKVGLLIGGGSGHEPLFHGFLGHNMGDGAACGPVFAAPPPETVLEATRAVSQGKGVLYLYGNYSGDNMSFDIAAEMASSEGIEVRTIRIRDDVATKPIEDRRGIAGDVFVIKIAGAAAGTLGTLEEVYAVTEKARDNTRSLGVAVKAGSTPESGEPTFELPEDEIEIGMGLHGEPGVSREKIQRTDPLVTKMMKNILEDLPFRKGDEVALLLNNLGSTTMMELLIANRRARQILDERGIRVYDTLIGSFCTTQEMAGFSISLLKLDAELKKLYDMPAESFALTMGARR